VTFSSQPPRCVAVGKSFGGRELAPTDRALTSAPVSIHGAHAAVSRRRRSSTGVLDSVTEAQPGMGGMLLGSGFGGPIDHGAGLPAGRCISSPSVPLAAPTRPPTGAEAGADAAQAGRPGGPLGDDPGDARGVMVPLRRSWSPIVEPAQRRSIDLAVNGDGDAVPRRTCACNGDGRRMGRPRPPPADR